MWCKLHFLITILSIFLFFNEVRSMNNDLNISSNSSIPAQIINNYLMKFIEHYNFFVSLTYLSSNHIQIQFQQSILTDLLRHSMNSYFTFAVGQVSLRSRVRITFNVMLVDNFDSFSYVFKTELDFIFT